MFGLMVFGAAAAYLGLMLWVITRAWRKRRARGGSVFQAFAFAAGGFLLVYLPVFWNHIPTILAHRNLCAKDAGFTVHVTPVEWARMNAGRLGELKGKDPSAYTSARETTSMGRTVHVYFGGLIRAEDKDDYWSRFDVRFRRLESLDRDVPTGRLLTSRVDYQTGERDDVRLWLFRRTCAVGSDPTPSDQWQTYFRQLREQLK